MPCILIGVGDGAYYDGGCIAVNGRARDTTVDNEALWFAIGDVKACASDASNCNGQLRRARSEARREGVTDGRLLLIGTLHRQMDQFVPIHTQAYPNRPSGVAVTAADNSISPISIPTPLLRGCTIHTQVRSCSCGNPPCLPQPRLGGEGAP